MLVLRCLCQENVTQIQQAKLLSSKASAKSITFIALLFTCYRMFVFIIFSDTVRKNYTHIRNPVGKGRPYICRPGTRKTYIKKKNN